MYLPHVLYNKITNGCCVCAYLFLLICVYLLLCWISETTCVFSSLNWILIWLTCAFFGSCLESFPRSCCAIFSLISELFRVRSYLSLLVGAPMVCSLGYLLVLLLLNHLVSLASRALTSLSSFVLPFFLFFLLPFLHNLLQCHSQQH